MAEIGYGYGSEFQLMRFLGHHRDEFDKTIKESIGINGDIHWLDFGYTKQSISGDLENKGLGFLYRVPFVNKEQITSIINEYHTYKINKIDNWQSWDAIFYIDECIYLVEAKAHVGELKSPRDNGGYSKGEILRFMKDQLPNLPVSNVWLEEYYQLANRLATTALIRKHKVNAKTLCLFFENGYTDKYFKRGDKNNTKEDFEEAIQEEMKTLGIDDNMTKDLLTEHVFINASPSK